MIKHIKRIALLVGMVLVMSLPTGITPAYEEPINPMLGPLDPNPPLPTSSQPSYGSQAFSPDIWWETAGTGRFGPVIQRAPAPPVTIDIACNVPFLTGTSRTFFGWTSKQHQVVSIILADYSPLLPFQVLTARQRIRANPHGSEFYLTLMAVGYTKEFEVHFTDDRGAQYVIKYHTDDFKPCV